MSGSLRMVDPLRYPPDGISDADVVEIRRIKARVDRERLPRGADPQTHLKLGRGGLADIEWTVQLLQLRYAGTVPALRSPRTLTALDAARAADLLSDADATRSTGRGAPSAGCATRSPWSPARAATSCRATPASAPPWRASWATAPAARTRWSTTTSAPPAAPAPSWTGSSGSDSPAFRWLRRAARPSRNLATVPGA